ncbi:MAG: TrkA family potassium uptake protein [Candidatus Brocadia sinica]|nr:TrkA family potassium uptake protein [Candidatus Brocadia sinica]NUO05407.1 TrkA family potassium uptake protein [Candidatus Brocadia sinica]
MRQFAVIGLGRFGRKIAETLAKKGAPVIAIDNNQELVEKVSDFVTKSIQMDSTDEKALVAGGIKDVDVAVVSMGEDIESSVLTTALLKNLDIKEIVARACTPLHAQILKMVGATRVVFPEEDMGIRVANSILSPGVLEYIELGADYTLAEIEAKSESIGHSISELDLRTKYGINVLIVKRKIYEAGENREEPIEKEVKVLPTSDYKIQEGDILVVVGSSEDIESFEKHMK